MSESIRATAEYNELLDSIKQARAAGQLRAARALNNALVEAYWQIGQEIVVRQREQGWGATGLSLLRLRYMAALAARWPIQSRKTSC